MNPRNGRRFGPWRRSLLLTWVCILLGLTAMCRVADPPTEKKIAFEPDTKIQKLINEAAYADKGETFFKKLEALQKNSGKGFDKLAPNLVYYSSRGKNLKEGMAAGLIIHYLAIGEDQVLGELLPYIGAEDELFRKELEGLIVALEPGFRELVGFEHITFAGYA